VTTSESLVLYVYFVFLLGVDSRPFCTSALIDQSPENDGSELYGKKHLLPHQEQIFHSDILRGRWGCVIRRLCARETSFSWQAHIGEEGLSTLHPFSTSPKHQIATSLTALHPDGRDSN
jgi:hypothetical protein